MHGEQLWKKVEREGGPAFARGAGPEGAEFCNGHPGMTLRDYFAAQAATGLVHFSGTAERFRPEDIAQAAFNIADAMIAERVKQR